MAGAAVLVAAALAGAAPAAAQSSGDSAVVYQREVFQYDRSARSDPFRSLLDSAELGVRVEDLSLNGVMLHPDPRRSVAVLSQAGSERRIRLRAGDRIGGIRVAAIGPRSVDLVVEEFGIARRETLELKTVSQKGGPE